MDVDAPDTLFEPTTQPLLPLQPLLDDAVAGDIVQLGDAHYLGPVTVPPGVVLRGLGAGRTTIGVPNGEPLRLDRNARLEHVRVIVGDAAGHDDRRWRWRSSGRSPPCWDARSKARSRRGPMAS